MPSHPPRRLLIVRNPTAGQRRRRHYARALDLLEAAGCAVTVTETGGRGDATRIAREADATAFDAIVAAGGDGTVNEVLNGLAGRSLPLGVIPLGTANVLAHEIGIGAGVEVAVRTILEGRPQPVALVRADGHYCCLMASAGYDARAMRRMRPTVKGLVGEGAYYLAGLEELLFGTPRMLSVEVDGARHEAAGVIAANGRLYGGKFVCAPDADLRQPRLHAVLLTRSGRWNALRYGSALIANRLYRLADVTILPATTIRIVEPDGEPCQGDGDLIGTTPVDIAVEAAAIVILYPPEHRDDPV